MNARDQVTVGLQYAGAAASDASSTNEGASCPSGTCQKTTMGYDGYGRLQSKHVPEQQVDPNNLSSTDHITWTYKPDDTIETVKDARGVIATFGYNARRLLTSITYPDAQSLPSGVSATANVTFAYDAAGNRTSMTDGSGSTTYGYDSLSRLSSESRSFVGLSGNYALSYQYNFANEVTLISLPFSSQQIGYGYDNAGRLSDVTASGFSSIGFRRVSTPMAT